MMTEDQLMMMEDQLMSLEDAMTDQFLWDQLMKNLYKAKGQLMVNYHMLMLSY